MNYLQMWIGKKPDNFIIDCMKTVLNKVSEDEIYYLISDCKWKFITDNCKGKVVWIKYSDYLKDMYEDNKQIEKLCKFFPNDLRHVVAMSDVIRAHFLSKTPNTLYCDADIILYKKLKLSDNIYMRLYGSALVDFHIIFNGTHLDFFKMVLDYLCDLWIGISEKKIRKGIAPYMPRNWIMRILSHSKIKNKIKLISSEFFKHLDNSKRA